MDPVKDPQNSSVLEKVQCNVTLQKNRVTSTTLQEAEAGYELLLRCNTNNSWRQQRGNMKGSACQIRVPPGLWVTTNSSAG